MNAVTDHEVLIEIKEKLNNLSEQFEKISSDTGFPRCVDREGRIKRLEQDVIALKKARAEFDTWLMRLTFMIIIVAVVKMAFFPAG